MELDKYAFHMGSLMVNFQTIEFELRAFLYEAENISGKEIFLDKKAINETIKGDACYVSAITNNDSLGELIYKYNHNSKVKSLGLTIDQNLKFIRNAIAHGRISGLENSDALHLIQFAKPKDNQTKVICNILLTEDRFNEQLQRQGVMLHKIIEAHNKLEAVTSQDSSKRCNNIRYFVIDKT
ncbi:hypothetical protein ACFLXC_04260 [Chloroflexota bacterium]